MNISALIRSIQIIYGAMATVAVAFGAFVMLVPAEASAGRDPGFEHLPRIVISALTVILLILSFWLPGKMLRAKDGAPIKERVLEYQRSKVTAGAMCEAPALMWGILIFLSGNPWYAAPMIICQACLLARFPSVMDLENAMGKRQKEINEQLAAH